MARTTLWVVQNEDGEYFRMGITGGSGEMFESGTEDVRLAQRFKSHADAELCISRRPSWRTAQIKQVWA